MDISEAMEKALDGNSILFVGAGYSIDTVNIAGEKLKSGKELMEFLYSFTGISEMESLEDAADVYVEQFGEEALVRLIKSEYTVKSVQEYHNDIAQIPWKRIYTTNYDTVIEESLKNVGKLANPITASDNISHLPKVGTLCIHFNGFVEKLTIKSIFSDLKLTEMSYVEFSLADSPLAIMLRQDLRSAQSIIFLGYSAYDLDIKRILSKVDIYKEKTFFYLGEHPSASTIRKCSHFGTVMKEYAAKFAADIDSLKSTYRPVSKENLPILALNEHTLPSGVSNIRDIDFFNLLLHGKRKDDLIYKSMSSKESYYLERPHINTVFEFIDKGHKVIVVCSDMGNGKSLLLEGFCLRATERGFRVFEAIEKNEETYLEVEKVAGLNTKVLMIFEEYQNWFDEIYLFNNNKNEDSVLILTARSAVNDVVFDELSELKNVEYIPEIQVDSLSENERQWFVNVLDEFGMWGENAGLSKSEKEKFVVEECNNQIHSILLKLLESPDIAARLKLISDAFKDNGKYYKIVLSSFILTLINYRVNLDTLSDIWGVEDINSSQFRRNVSIKEMIDFSSNSLEVRSPVAAEYILSHIADKATVVSTLITMAKKVDVAAKFSQQYRQLFRSLTIFSNLQNILPVEGRNAAVINYYESIKNLYGCRKNPLFWLQYGIATLIAGDLYRSKKFFETAYSLADKRDSYDTFQIDNHYARLLLIEAIELSPEQCMSNFRKAKMILNRQMQQKERRHYPYKVSLSYQNIIDKHGNSLKAIDLEEIKRAAVDVLERIQRLPEMRRMHKYVKQANEAMLYVAKRVDEFLEKLKNIES